MKQFRLALIGLTFLASCAVPFLFKADPCTTSKVGNVTTISCPDGTSSEIYDGEEGAEGPQGVPGNNGHSALVSMTAASSAQCVNGGTIIVMAVDTDDNGVLDPTDGSIQSAVLCNGQNGTNAPPTPFTPIAVIDPCGKKMAM